jgi:hypothetical protein
MLKHITKNALNQFYVIEKFSIAGVARKLNTSPVTIRKYLKFHDIPFRDNPQKPKDITGQRFGRLIALHPSSPDRFGKSRWHCICDCGRTVEINYSSLAYNLTTSCGCHKIELCRCGGYQTISRAWWRKLVKGAAQRGYEFSISPEDVWVIYEQQGKRCVFTNLPIEFFPDSNRIQFQTASLDRIDSNLGYVKENIQVVHKVINQMKGYLTDEEFSAFCNLVAQTKPLNYDVCLSLTSRTVLRKQT